MLKDNPLKIFECSTKGEKYKIEVFEDINNFGIHWDIKEYTNNRFTGGGTFNKKENLIKTLKDRLIYSSTLDKINYKIRFNSISPEIKEIVS